MSGERFRSKYHPQLPSFYFFNDLQRLNIADVPWSIRFPLFIISFILKPQAFIRLNAAGHSLHADYRVQQNGRGRHERGRWFHFYCNRNQADSLHLTHQILTERLQTAARESLCGTFYINMKSNNDFQSPKSRNRECFQILWTWFGVCLFSLCLRGFFPCSKVMLKVGLINGLIAARCLSAHDNHDRLQEANGFKLKYLYLTWPFINWGNWSSIGVHNVFDPAVHVTKCFQWVLISLEDFKPTEQLQLRDVCWFPHMKRSFLR